MVRHTPRKATSQNNISDCVLRSEPCWHIAVQQLWLCCLCMRACARVTGRT
jgi:hypothetical protein